MFMGNPRRDTWNSFHHCDYYRSTALWSVKLKNETESGWQNRDDLRKLETHKKKLKANDFSGCFEFFPIMKCNYLNSKLLFEQLFKQWSVVYNKSFVLKWTRDRWNQQFRKLNPFCTGHTTRKRFIEKVYSQSGCGRHTQKKEKLHEKKQHDAKG